MNKILTLLLILTALSTIPPSHAQNYTDWCSISFTCVEEASNDPNLVQKLKDIITNILNSTYRPTIIYADPNTLPQGSDTTLMIFGADVDFNQNSKVIFENSGIVVKESLFISNNKILAHIYIPDAVSPGLYDAKVETFYGTEDKSAKGSNILRVEAATEQANIINIKPSRIVKGGSDINLLLYGYKTQFNENSIVKFNRPGIELISQEVINERLLSITVNINSTAAIGIYDVSVTTNGKQVTTKGVGLLSVFEQFKNPTIASISPESAARGDDNIKVIITGKNVQFNTETQVVFGGNDIVVNDVTLLSTNEVEANISIANNAKVGSYNIYAMTGEENASLLDGFRIYPQAHIQLSPTTGTQGETISLQIIGQDVSFSANQTALLIGNPRLGVSIENYAVINNKTITANLNVSNDAKLGEHIISVANGEQVLATLFRVNKKEPVVNDDPPPPVTQLKSFSPQSASQGQQIKLTVTGENTNFQAGNTELSFYGDNINIKVESLEVKSSTELVATVTLSSQVKVGQYDFKVTTNGISLDSLSPFSVQVGVAEQPETEEPAIEQPTDEIPATQLTLSVSGQGLIQVPHLNQTCQASACPSLTIEGDTVQLVASPTSPQIQFTGWTGDCEIGKTETTYILQLTQKNMSCGALFEMIDETPITELPLTPTESVEPIQEFHQFSLTIEGSGIVNVITEESTTHCEQSSCDFEWIKGTILSLQTLPNENYIFDTIVGINCQQTIIALNQNIHCIVNFVKEDVIEGATEILLPTCPKTGKIDHVCNAEQQKLKDISVGQRGQVGNAVLLGNNENQGWILNATITENAQLNNGFLSGFILNKGIISNVEFKGKYIIGGTLAGRIINHNSLGTSYFKDVKLAPNAVLSGGGLRGKIQGDPESPAFLSSVIIASGTYLSHVIITKDVIFKPQAIIGEGVIFESDVVLEQPLIFEQALPQVKFKDIEALPYYKELSTLVNHNISYPCNLESQGVINLKASLLPIKISDLITQMNELELIQEQGWRFYQDDAGVLQLNAGKKRFLLQVASVYKEEDKGLSSNIWITEQALHLVLDQGIHLIAYPYLFSPCTLQESFEDLNRTNAKRSEPINPLQLHNTGSVSIAVSENSFLHVRIGWETKPTQVLKKGLYTEPHPLLPNRTISFLVYPDQAHQLRQQRLYPAVVDHNEFYEAVEQVEVENETGWIRFIWQGKVYEGILDYMIVRSTPIAKFQVTSTIDYNQDGVNDIMLNYPNGMQQVLFHLVLD